MTHFALAVVLAPVAFVSLAVYQFGLRWGLVAGLGSSVLYLLGTILWATYRGFDSRRL
jgi:hypothetical protein